MQKLLALAFSRGKNVGLEVGTKNIIEAVGNKKDNNEAPSSRNNIEKIVNRLNESSNNRSGYSESQGTQSINTMPIQNRDSNMFRSDDRFSNQPGIREESLFLNRDPLRYNKMDDNFNRQPESNNRLRSNETFIPDRNKCNTNYNERDNFTNQPGRNNDTFDRYRMNKRDSFGNFAINQPPNRNEFMPNRDTFVSGRPISDNFANQPGSSNNGFGQNRRNEEDYMAKRGRFNDNNQEFPRNQIWDNDNLNTRNFNNFPTNERNNNPRNMNNSGRKNW